MTRHTNQDFIRGGVAGQVRTLTMAGIAAMVAGALVLTVVVIVYPRATEPSGTRFSVIVPTLGPGVKQGSKVLLRGAAVGEVTEITALDTGEIDLELVLDDSGTAVLTDTFEIDYRPENYFGVTAVYLSSKPGGQAIRPGQVFARNETPDYTMSTMLETGSLVIDGSLTGDVIASLDKVMRYANGLAPLIRSGIIVADQVARTQQQLPSVHLGRINRMLEEFPAFGQEVAGSLYAIINSRYNQAPVGAPVSPDIEMIDTTDATLALLGSDLFGAAGALLGSHGDEITPLTLAVKEITDPIPGMIGGPDTVAQFAELINRLDGAFTGGPEDKTLQLRVMLRSMPGLAAPMASMGVSGTEDRTGGTR